MSNKRRRSSCKYHVIGQYYHSSSELYNFCLGSEIDGLGTSLGITYYNYCPKCGEKITERIKVYQMNLNIEDVGKDTERTCIIPKRRRKIPKRKSRYNRL